MIYEKPYTFEVQVIWAKPDGEDEKAFMSIDITWYDLVMPDFNIQYEPKTTLMTSKDNALFYLEPINFPIDNIQDYDVIWTIEPELENMGNFSVLSNGRVMQINKGKFTENTSYKVSLSVSHYKLEKLSQERSIEFQTLAPPVGGKVTVSPLEGFVGDEFTIVLNGWTSANLPIEYNVYNTFDADGSRKGALVNSAGPIPVDEPFTFVATRTTPIIV